MSDEQERLARNLNAGIETASGCAGCGVAFLLVIAGVPMVALAAFALVGIATGSDWAGVVAASVAVVWLLLVAARLAGWRR